MAKKNENKLSYLQMPLPEGRKHYKMTKRSWSGLNYRQTIDTGALSMENNISTLEAPYLTPSPIRQQFSDNKYEHPISLFGFDDFLIVIYRKDSSIYVDYIDSYSRTYTGILQIGDATEDDEFPRSIVQFNSYIMSDDIINGEYEKRLLVFPDKKSMYFDLEKLLDDENNDTGHDFMLYDMDVLIKEYYNDIAEVDEGGAVIYSPPDSASHNYYYRNSYNSNIYLWSEYETVKRDEEWGLNENGEKYGFVLDENGNYIKDGGTAYGWKVSAPPVMPNIKYAAVHLSRLFGVSDDSVYASGYNDYTNWNLDTVDEYNESNAWCSKAQSNTKADGDFTGITTFQGHIVCFKRDFMHEIYNTKNPFRIQDIYAEGTIDNRTIQDVDGRLIFVSEDNVKVYTGSDPRILSYCLNIEQFVEAVSGTDNRNYYLYCKDADGKKHLFVYDTFVEQWSEQSIDSAVLNFAHNKNGMYMLCNDGYIYKVDTRHYSHSWSFETDLFTNETVNIKHIKKLQMFADIATGANIKVYILYDDEEFDEDTSHLVYSSTGYGQKPIRVKPRKTASYGIKLHIEGYGYVRLYELELFMENGGDLYVSN